MRVISGSARRITLEVADESPTRPFLEMARGALFNSLGGRIPEARVLDLYAGSGALGIEALSRGAKSCVFVERDHNAFRILENNVRKCKFEKRARLVRDDVTRAVTGLAGPFDLVFVDPPFPDAAAWSASGGGDDLLRNAAALLEPDALLILRYEVDNAPPPAWPGLELARDDRYGRSRICRYRNTRHE